VAALRSNAQVHRPIEARALGNAARHKLFLVRAIGVGLLTALVFISLSGCGGSSGHARGISLGSHTGSGTEVVPQARLQLPARGVGCGGVVRVDGGAERIPATVTDRDGQVSVLVNVCIAGRGPYPFVVDTGSSVTAVDARLVRSLGLKAVGKPEQLAGAGCVTHGRRHLISDWSVSGLPLRPQTVLAVDIPDMGRPGEPDGILGSDVWDRFGDLRIDFRHGDLVVPGIEGAAATRRILITRPAASRLPRSLVSSRPEIVAPMTVAASPQGVVVLVAAAFGSHAPHEFVVDTGARISAVTPHVARTAGLKHLSQRIMQSTLCSVAVLGEVATARWSMIGTAVPAPPRARNALHPQPIATIRLPGGLGGSFGSDQMFRYGSVVIDYAGGRILLGAG
jgi:Aspartyl protease